MLNTVRTIWCLILLVCTVIPAAAQSTATYKVTFTSTWSAATHPTDFPANPHYSGMIGVTHDAGAVFWQPGSLASPGIKQMAETGNNSTINSEFGTAVTAGTAEFIVNGSGLSSPGSIEKTFTISQGHSRVTFVAMVAPSPDWFVGVHGENLFVGGSWVDKTITAFAYDAGTDDGVTYSSSNAPSMPPQNIVQITGSPINGVAVGEYKFELQTLPVELAEFSGVRDGNAAVLRWQTASEQNSAGFAVEHSRQIGSSSSEPTFSPFAETVFVTSAGNSLVTETYSQRIENLEPGAHRFRLRMVDLDGSYSYSSTLEIDIALPNSHQLSRAYPNPFSSATSFSLQVAERQSVTIEVFDVLGQRVMELGSETLDPGAARIYQINASTLESGVYFVRATGDSFTDTQRLILAK